LPRAQLLNRIIRQLIPLLPMVKWIGINQL
jgi:hypothetical protein